MEGFNSFTIERTYFEYVMQDNNGLMAAADTPGNSGTNDTANATH